MTERLNILTEKRLGAGEIFQKLPSLGNNNIPRRLKWKGLF